MSWGVRLGIAVVSMVGVGARWLGVEVGVRVTGGDVGEPWLQRERCL